MPFCFVFQSNVGTSQTNRRGYAFILKAGSAVTLSLDLRRSYHNNRLGRGRSATSFYFGANSLCCCLLFVVLLFSHFLSEIVTTCFKMVKVSFNTALAQKDVKKDAETLIPEEDKVSRKWLTAN